jgi:ABC-2 type transport system ATP-binding protein
MISFYTMIQIENLTYRYNRKKSLFNGLDLLLLPGKIYGLLGKNGAGKSSLIKNIAGLLFPTNGKITVAGIKPGQRATSFLENMFYIPEECELPALPLPAFVELYAPFYPAFDREEFIACLKVFNVNYESHLQQLSFGQRKKAYIAFALAANTKLLIMDEPTNGLDIPSKLQLRNLIARADRKDTIIIISTHQVRDLDDLIHSIIIIDNSELLLFADKETVSRKLYFSLGEPSGASTLYEEQTPQGLACIKPNPDRRPSYVDIEILFNAILNRKEALAQLLKS